MAVWIENDGQRKDSSQQGKEKVNKKKPLANPYKSLLGLDSGQTDRYNRW